MADLDADVLDLVRRLNALVAADTGGRSAGPSELVLEVARNHEQALQALAQNLDIPARLASGPRVVLTRASRQAVDQRAEVRAALTAIVAASASSLDAPRSLPPAADQGHRDRLRTAIADAYASAAAPQLSVRLLTNGRPGDLGLFPPPLLEGDPSAARALALAIGARIDRRDSQVLAALVGAGAGGAGEAAARLVLDRSTAFRSLPSGTEQDGFVQDFAARLEEGFAARDRGAAEGRKLTDEIENRRVDISGGAGAVDNASQRTAAEMHEFLESLPEWQKRAAPAVERPTPPGLPTERPASVGELIQGMRATVRDLTGAPESLGNGEFTHMPGSREWDDVYVAHDADGTLYLNDAKVIKPLELLTADGPAVLTERQKEDARAALQSVTATLSWQAVPDGYTRADEVKAQAAVGPELTDAVGRAFSEDYLGRIVEQNLPGELASQLNAEPPFVDSERAPAARAFARSIDDLTGRDAVPSETLRQLAGQHRAAIGETAAEVLMLDSGIPREQQPAVAREIAGRVDAAFGMLPAQVEAWRAAGTAEGDIAGKSREFGQRLAQEAHASVRARQDPALRFAADPALTPLRKSQAPGATPAATRTATAEQAKPVRDR